MTTYQRIDEDLDAIVADMPPFQMHIFELVVRRLSEQEGQNVSQYGVVHSGMLLPSLWTIRYFGELSYHSFIYDPLLFKIKGFLRPYASIQRNAIQCRSELFEAVSVCHGITLRLLLPAASRSAIAICFPQCATTALVPADVLLQSTTTHFPVFKTHETAIPWQR